MAWQDNNGNWHIDDENSALGFDLPTLRSSLGTGNIQRTLNGGYFGAGSTNVATIPTTTATIPGFFNGSLNPLNWGWKNLFGGNELGLDEFSQKMLGKPFSALDPSERMQLSGLFQQDQQNRMFSSMRGLGWGGLALQGLGSVLNWTQGNKQLELARDNLDFMKEQANRNWEATAKNYNDKAAATNYNRTAFAGGDISPRMRYIDESKISA